MTDQRLTLQQIAEIVGGSVEGDGGFVMASLATLDEAGPQDLTFADKRRAAALSASKAGAAIVDRAANVDAAARPLVRVDDVQLAVYKLLCAIAPKPDRPETGIHPAATVAPDARLGKDVAIGAGAVIGSGAAVGDRTVVHPNAVITAGCVVGCDCEIAQCAVIRNLSVLGERVRIGPNSVIGYDGFGFQTIQGVHHRVPHVGRVVIEDDVEIDACTCVDRAKFGTTRICRGAKVDNEVQIAHNCRIGPGSVVAGSTGIAGSVKTGRYCVLAGHVGIRDNITLGDGVQVGAYTPVYHDVAAGVGVLGVPARPAEETMRLWAAQKKLPDLLKRVRELESRLESLESVKTENH